MATQQDRPADEAARGSTQNGASGSILIVDDDTEMRTLIADVLTREGYSVAGAPSAEDALALLAEHEYQLVLTDMKMAGMSGLELLTKVKGLRADIAVILVTAFGSIDTAIEAMRQGAAHFLTKPVKMKELILAVERTLETREMRVLAEDH